MPIDRSFKPSTGGFSQGERTSGECPNGRLSSALSRGKPQGRRESLEGDFHFSLDKGLVLDIMCLTTFPIRVEEKTMAKKTTKKAAKKASKKAAPKAKKVAKVAKAAKTAKPKKATAKRTVNAAFMKPLTPSELLAQIVGATPLPRTEVVKKLWAYIRKNNLQDQKNRRQINADAKLKPIFGKAAVSMFEMTKLVSKHLK